MTAATADALMAIFGFKRVEGSEMKSDRELLELAARAAGYWSAEFGCADNLPHLGWNPLTDDGDALRLAAVLRLHILQNDPGEPELWVSAVLNKRGQHGVDEFNDEAQRTEATRRAIVRAAAAIGEAMQ